VGAVFGLHHDTGRPVELGEDDYLGGGEGDALGGGGHGEDGAGALRVFLELIHSFVAFLHVNSPIYTYIVYPLL